ncbi:MAG: serine--tRNA ligase [Candidatus Omnitrophica bacterium]|nr:serine--tRNA ligase [Candidatus Omnitrophota bacterium]
MLDIKFIRENADKVQQGLKNKNSKIDIKVFLELDKKRREFLTQTEKLKSEKNSISSEIALKMKEKQDASSLIVKNKELASAISLIENELELVQKEHDNILMKIPNIPHESVPVGGPEANKVIKEWGTKKKFSFNLKDHIQLGEKLDILDFTRAAKISGSGFSVYKGLGSTLLRALINFMLDLHTKEHGYIEVFPPFLVNRQTMTGTGQLPSFEEDLYALKDDALFLIPTAEVPVTNLYAGEVLDGTKLPLYHAAYSACFRREAGSYGKDTKGLTRVHQFNKVELVKFVKPDTSYDEHEKLRENAEKVLELLELPYRTILLATGDMSFSASKCYDLELWSPAAEKWLEVSSCSNFEDFQARRANIKYKTNDMKKAEYIHTLNASGLALPRLVISILENYQNEDGSVSVPKVLKPYMGGIEKIGVSD